MENKYKDMKDEELVKLAQDGDQEAGEFLLHIYKNVVKSKARTYYILGADGEDVVQEAMIGLFKAIKSYSKKREASFSTYADVCINRQIFDAMKAARRKKHEPLNNSLSLNYPMDGDSDTTLGEVLPGELEEDLETGMLEKEIFAYVSENKEGTFSNMEVQVWNAYIAGKSYEEIGEDLKKNPKSVYNAMERIKKKVMFYLKQNR